jgi:hypothetical protein
MVCEFLGTLFVGIFLYGLGVGVRRARRFGRWWGRNVSYRDQQQRGFQVLPPTDKLK